MKIKKLFFLPILLLSMQIGNGQKLIETRGPENGTLLIIGGYANDTIFLPIFSRLAGGYEAPVVVIPTARDNESLSKDSLFQQLKERFTSAGFKDVTILHTRDRELANSDNFILPLKKAKGVWFLGGRQWRLADSYLNTKTHDAFIQLLKRGGVIAGSSAGATIQGSFLARGDTRKNTIMVGDHLEGLAFISNIAIDQHLLARNRQFDMFEILVEYPNLLGIGLEENTGIIVRADTCEVVGESYVAIYDGTRWSAERDTVYQLPQGSKEFYFLGVGDKYDLRNRKVVPGPDASK
jgi:cyanophycinase